MPRTHVYLGDQELELLKRVGTETGASRSELIRRAVRSTYGEPDKSERLRLLRESAGIWHDRDFTGAEYVDAIRGDLNERLKQLGFE